MLEQSPWQTQASIEPMVQLDADKSFDYVVVGGGFTGLSIAYHLACLKGSHGIALVEATEVGSGASGRNSGMIGPGIWGTYDRMEKKFGPELAHSMFAHTQCSVRAAIEWIQSDTLDCDLVVGKQIKVAITSTHQEKLMREVDALKGAGFAVRGLEKADLSKAIFSDRYRYGLEFPESATVNPMALAKALKQRLIAMGVQVFEQTPVSNIQSHAQLLELQTPKALLKAQHLVLAVNGFMPAMGILKNRIFPISTHLLRTQPLTNSQRQVMGISIENAFIDTRRIFNFFRLTPDHRLIFGGGKPALNIANKFGRFDHTVNEAAKAALCKELTEVFPSLANHPIETVWRGTMGFTIDNLPVLGHALDQRVFMAGAWCGHGLALSLANGKMIAQMCLDRSLGPSMPWHRRSAPLMPPGSLLAPSLGAYIASLSLADRWDLLQTRNQSKANRPIPSVAK